jgi:soluble lytic murein transglycosylase
VCKVRLIWVLNLLLIASGVQPISAQNDFAPLPFGGSPLDHASMAAPAITASDLAAVREAIGFASRGRPKDATEAKQRIDDPTASKLVEWAILRSGDNGADFVRFQAFIVANPNWPNITMFRRRAEAKLWDERANLATTRTLTGDTPVSAKGRFALGRALLAQGDRAGAQALIGDAWRTEPMTFDAEEEILQSFGDLITRADDKARMEHWLYANDTNPALRAAIRLGGNEPAIVKARAVVNEKASNAKALIESLPLSARQDAGVLFSRIQLLRRADKTAEAAELMLSAPHEVAQIYDPDQWWIERRLLARKLLDANAAPKAYRIVRDAAPCFGWGSWSADASNARRGSHRGAAAHRDLWPPPCRILFGSSR